MRRAATIRESDDNNHDWIVNHVGVLWFAQIFFPFIIIGGLTAVGWMSERIITKEDKNAETLIQLQSAVEALHDEAIDHEIRLRAIEKKP
jgi:hypothetical protein